MVITLSAGGHLTFKRGFNLVYDETHHNVRATSSFKYPHPVQNYKTYETRMGTIVNYIDADNYYAAEYEYTTELFTLYKVVAGTKTVLDSELLSIIDLTKPDPLMVEMEHGVTLTGLDATTGTWTNYRIDIPDGTTQVVVASTTGTGDMDLFLKDGQVAGEFNYDETSSDAGSVESVTLVSPVNSTLYVGLLAYDAYTGVDLTATFTPAPDVPASTDTHLGDGYGGRGTGYHITVDIHQDIGIIKAILSKTALPGYSLTSEFGPLITLSSTDLALASGGKAGTILEKDSTVEE